jgi:hypothetical protein
MTAGLFSGGAARPGTKGRPPHWLRWVLGLLILLTVILLAYAAYLWWHHRGGGGPFGPPPPPKPIIVPLGHACAPTAYQPLICADDLVCAASPGGSPGAEKTCHHPPGTPVSCTGDYPKSQLPWRVACSVAQLACNHNYGATDPKVEKGLQGSCEDFIRACHAPSDPIDGSTLACGDAESALGSAMEAAVSDPGVQGGVIDIIKLVEATIGAAA